MKKVKLQMENSQILYLTSPEYLSPSGFEIQDCGKGNVFENNYSSSGRRDQAHQSRMSLDRAPPSVVG
jgi:hypothetical protein